jgi:hypothetical protein
MNGTNKEAAETGVAAATTIPQIAAVWIANYAESWPYWASVVVLAGCIGHWL